MGILHFKIRDHFDNELQLVNQNKAVPVPAQGDLMETSGLYFMFLEKYGLDSFYKTITDGIYVMYQGVNGKIIPRVKSFTDEIPKTEPDRWDNVGGIYYRVKDMSHAQAWYIWAGLHLLGKYYPKAKELADGFGKRIIDDGYKLKWDGQTTYSGSFTPIYPSAAHLRAYHLGKTYGKSIPFMSRIWYWLLPVWTKVLKAIGKYDDTDGFNAAIVLYLLNDKSKLKKHLADNPGMVSYLKNLYDTNTSDNADVIQNDCKWLLVNKMMSDLMS